MNVVSFEGYWGWNDYEKQATRLIETVAKMNSFRKAEYTVNSLVELKEARKKFIRLRNYDIVYFAFHGNPGQLFFGENKITLEELSLLFKKRFENKIVHFGTCETINVDDNRIYDFMKLTGAKMVSGYTTSVDWIASACLDMLYFQTIQGYKNLRCFQKYFYKNVKIQGSKIKMFFRK